MKVHRIAAGMFGVCLGSLAAFVYADPSADLIIEETFTGYPDNALISTSPAGPALGLIDDWRLVPNSDFYVNRTQADHDAGTGKAVYDRPSDDNGTRTATRSTSMDHTLYKTDGDVFYASFLIDPARTYGHMMFELELERLNGGGALDFAFGITSGEYTVGNGGTEVDARGGTVTTAEQLVLVRIEYGDAETGPDDDEVVTLWVDPVDELSTPVINDVSTDFLSSGGGKISAISIRAEKMSGVPAFFDDLRVGSSFSAVIPPPATDLNGDGAVDDRDLNILLSGLGGEYPPDHLDALLADFSGPGTKAGPSSVPEPSGLTLMCVGLVGLIFVRRFRR